MSMKLARFYAIGFTILVLFDTLVQLSFKYAGDHAFPFQPLHATQAGGRRQVHAFGQLGIGQPPGALQLGEQQQVGAIEVDGGVHEAIIPVGAQLSCAQSPVRRNDASPLRG